jgi:hypothetical protein
MTDNITNNSVKFFLSCIFVLTACLSLNAAEQQNKEKKPVKEATEIKKEAAVQMDNGVVEQEPVSVVFSISPIALSSSCFFRGDSELPQQTIDENLQANKICRGKILCPTANDLCLLYSPKQRQKLSVAAIQCGSLTSFGSQSPPLLTNVVISS